MVVTPESIIEEHASDHPNGVIAEAKSLIGSWDKWKRGCAPRGGAAAAVYGAYMVSENDRPKQEEIADEFDVSVVTLRKVLHGFDNRTY